MPSKSQPIIASLFRSMAGNTHTIITNNTETNLHVYLSQKEIKIEHKRIVNACIGGGGSGEGSEEDDQANKSLPTLIESDEDSNVEEEKTTVLSNAAGAAGDFLKTGQAEMTKETTRIDSQGGELTQTVISTGESEKICTENDYYLTIASPIRSYDGVLDHHHGKPGFVIHKMNVFVRKNNDYEITKSTSKQEVNFIPNERLDSFRKVVGFAK